MKPFLLILLNLASPLMAECLWIGHAGEKGALE
jgi:hypothetical protein